MNLVWHIYLGQRVIKTKCTGDFIRIHARFVNNMLPLKTAMH